MTRYPGEYIPKDKKLYLPYVCQSKATSWCALLNPTSIKDNYKLYNFGDSSFFPNLCHKHQNLCSWEQFNPYKSLAHFHERSVTCRNTAYAMREMEQIRNHKKMVKFYMVIPFCGISVPGERSWHKSIALPTNLNRHHSLFQEL
ncbi:hypothetical protein SAY87_012703 [Trapa incisa]|uniref:Uncharacterized protein n=1 Tax=Trapa incisa TaxID=236973 RepID=A0AAN7JCB4_9MYRT|nr:hypothetical protein SAY87_012703 [Trapa incisa]